MKKLLIIGVILLFLGVACSSSIYADEYMEQWPTNTICSKAEKIISLQVIEYKPDGINREYIVKLPESQYNEMLERVQTAGDMEERLSIYKEYKIFPDNVTCESLQAGMEEKAKRLAIDTKMLKNKVTNEGKTSIIDNFFFSYRNMNCTIALAGVLGIFFPRFGSSLFTAKLNILKLFIKSSLYNWFPEYLIPSVDLLNGYFGFIGFLLAEKGMGKDIRVEILLPIIFMFGFVGYYIMCYTPTTGRLCMSIGYTSYIRAVGLLPNFY